MRTHLLDVNVLLALVWPRHEHHPAAHRWFEKSGRRAWATNSITQLGVLRLLTNPAVTHRAVGAATAFEVLSRAIRHEGHEFWSLDNNIVPCLEAFVRRIQGHQQWADAALLSHAAAREGVLVSFDTGLKSLAGREFGDSLLLLK